MSLNFLSASANAVLFTTTLVLITSPAAAQDLELVGVVRDFRESHPDFGVASALSGTGHFAGNLDLALAADGRPVFQGGGIKVAQEWLDAAGQPLAPHLYQEPGAGADIVEIGQAPLIIDGGVADTFDSNMGSYGGSNVGPAPTFDVGAPMPVLTEPSLGPSIGDYVRNVAGMSIIDADLHCDKFLVSNGHVIMIDGPVTLLVEEEFKLANFAAIELLPNAELEIWVKKDATLQDSAELNVNTANPSRVTFYNLGTLIFNIQNQSQFYGHVQSPNAGLLIENNADLYGGFWGESLEAKNDAGFHVDTSAATTLICGVAINDTAGTAAAVGDGGITSATTFDGWYRDLLGTNFSVQHPVVLADNGSGIYEYHDDSFYPIDHRLFGNEDEAHNNYFTYSIEYDFTYEPCTGQFFEFKGSDDAWVYIGDLLAIDLGGIQPDTNQVVDLDRLDLAPGQTYHLSFFYAHRSPGTPSFNVATNVKPIAGAAKALFSATEPRD